MRTFSLLRQYCAEFFLKWQMFQIKLYWKSWHMFYVQKLFFFFRKSCLLWDNVEKYGTAREATDNNTIGRTHFACWITKVTVTHSDCSIIIAFPRWKLFCERTTVLRYTYVPFLSVVSHWSVDIYWMQW